MYAGDVLLVKEGAELWSMQEDEVGDIVFVHAETQASASVGIPEVLCMESIGSSLLFVKLLNRPYEGDITNLTPE